MAEPVKHGQMIERYFVVVLRDLGCKVEQSAVLDHKHKLDAVITGFHGIEQTVSLGIQVTTRPNQADKIDKFLRTVNTKPSYTKKALFVELLNEDIDAGVGRVAYATMVYFMFSDEYHNIPVARILVKKDFTVELARFDNSLTAPPAAEFKPGGLPVRPGPRPVGTSGQSTPKPPRGVPGGVPTPNRPAAPSRFGETPSTSLPRAQPLVAVKGDTTEGYIVRLNPSGFGFIDVNGNEFFFHFKDIIDAELHEDIQTKLQEASGVLKVRMPVRFVHMGTQEGKNRPIAGSVASAFQ